MEIIVGFILFGIIFLPGLALVAGGLALIAKSIERMGDD